MRAVADTSQAVVFSRLLDLDVESVQPRVGWCVDKNNEAWRSEVRRQLCLVASREAGKAAGTLLVTGSIPVSVARAKEAGLLRYVDAVAKLNFGALISKWANHLRGQTSKELTGMGRA